MRLQTLGKNCQMINIPTNSLLRRVLLALATAVVIVWFYPHQRSSQYIYEQGRPWNYSQLIAPFDIPIHPDSLTVQAIRDTLTESFVPIYTINTNVIDTIIKELPKGHNSARLGKMLRRYYEQGVVESGVLGQIREGKLPRVRLLEKNILSEQSTAVFTSPRDIYHRLDSAITDPDLRRYFISANLHSLLQPNVLYSEVDSKRHFDNEFQTLTADRGVILQGQAIINKGDIISPQDFTNLQTYEQLLDAHLNRQSQSNLLTALGQFLYVAILLALLMLYCALLVPAIYHDFRALCFIYSLITIFVLFAILMNTFVPGGVYIVPMAIVPILVLVFFDGRTALFVATTSVILIAPITSFVLEFIYLQVCAVAVAVYSLRELSRRSQLLRTAAVVALAYMLGYLSLELLMNGSLNGWTWRMPAFLGANALLVSMAYILMFAVERLFGFVSSVTLVELSDTNQPLLRKLSDSCPGTFQHSMSVSNLASDAARAMGANESLVRAGALYHDIGKMNNPAFFTENQRGVNPHDALPPEQSARIVISHVADGLRAADKAGLPSVIKDFISEHHGAGMAKYFYFKAAKNMPEGQKPDPALYTYPGPNPRSRETSLLMMADAVEAASRSLSDYSRESITALVDKIINTQITDGLNDNSTLEFRDVRLIKDAFIKRLLTIYHTRIAYPEAPKNL